QQEVRGRLGQPQRRASLVAADHRGLLAQREGGEEEPRDRHVGARLLAQLAAVEVVAEYLGEEGGVRLHRQLARLRVARAQLRENLAVARLPARQQLFFAACTRRAV